MKIFCFCYYKLSIIFVVKLRKHFGIVTKLDEKNNVSSTFYEGILNNLDFPISIIDNLYKYTFINDAYKRFFEVDNSILGNKISASKGTSNFNSIIKSKFDKCLRGETVEFEYWYIKNELAYLLNIKYTPYKDKNGKIISVVSTITDVTAQRQFEGELTESFSHYYKSINAIEDLIIITNNEYIIEDVNKVVEKTFGLFRKDIIGKKCFSFLRGKQSACEDCVHKKIGQPNAEPEFINFGDKVFSIKSNKVLDKEGNVSKYIDIFKDETENIELKKSLKYSQEKLSSITDNVPDIIFIINEKNKNCFEYVNKSMAELTGWQTDGENRCDLFEKVFYDDDKYIIESIFKYGLGKKNSFKIRLNTADGGIIWTEQKFSLSYDLDGNIELVGIVRNINEQLIYEKKLLEINRELQKQKLKAEESDNIKTEFLSIISHELRTPLNSIIGFSSLLSDDLTKEELEEFKDTIYLNGKSLLSIINSILKFVEIIKDEVNIYHEYINLEELLEDISSLAQYELQLQNKQNLSIHLNKSTINSKPVVFTDRNVLLEVLMNLIKNSIKFTLKGVINFGYHILPDNSLVFYVSDTGVGIAPEKQNTIFEAFKQNENYNIRQFGGVGIGLTIAKRLIDLLKGKIWFQSKENVGTTFYFSLTNPELIISNDIERTNELKLDKVYDFENKRILVVEDDISNSVFLRSLFTLQKAEVVLASDGHDAIEIATNQEIDLILMDIKLLTMDGVEARKEINNVKNTIPIVAVTSLDEHKDVERIKNAGFLEVIPKPIDKNKLLEIISKYL